MNISSLLEVIPVNPPCSFDNLDYIDDLVEQLDSEVMKYTEFGFSKASQYEEPGSSIAMRIGCFYESTLRSRCGDFILEEAQ